MVATWFSYVQKRSAGAATGLLIGMACALAVPVEAGAAGQSSSWIDHGDGVLTQSQSHLQWSRADNGADIDWTAAKAFCAGKGAPWRLPSVDELAGLAAQSALDRHSTACGGGSSCLAPSQFRLSGAWFWSAAAVDNDPVEPGELAWGVSLVNGKRTKTLMDVAYGSRALCVR
jgi:hypothetical protein